MTTQPQIKTEVETNNDRIKTTDYDVEACVDDGEYAMCYMIRRVGETTIEQQAVACEAGVRENYGHMEVFDIPADASVVDLAREVVNSDPEMDIELAREHFK